MKQIFSLLFLLIFNIILINNVFWNNINKWCSWPMYRPFDRIVLFDRFNAINSPVIKDYSLDDDKKKKLDNILYKVSDEKKAIFLINIEKIFKKKLDKYSKNIKGYSKWWNKYYTKNEILKIKLLYSLNFYFAEKYNKYDKLKETKVIDDELVLNNWIKLKLKKITNLFIPELNCLQIYDWYNNIFESNDYSNDLNVEIKFTDNNIFLVTYRNVWSNLLNKNLLKIYHIWVWKLTIQDPFYMDIINIKDNNNIIINTIWEYTSKLKF